jgi:hypothetical protein
MALNDRRKVQSAADASSLAGVRAASSYLEDADYVDDIDLRDCSGTTPGLITNAMGVAKTSAVGRAVTNIVSIDQDISDKNGVDATYNCKDYGGYTDKYIDVTTQVTRGIPSTFTQFFIEGGLINTVESIARLHPRTIMGYGYAVVAIRGDCSGPGSNKGGVYFNGSDDTQISGGVYSNACMVINGDPDVTSDMFYYRSLPAPVPEPPNTTFGTDSTAMLPFGIEPVKCETLPDNPPTTKDTTTNDVTVYHPGHYSTIIDIHGNYDATRLKGTNTRFEPGLYCLNNGMKLSGGLITGDAVTFYMIGGGFETSGGAEIHLRAPMDYDTKPAYPGVEGMLIYLPPGNISAVKMTGSAGSTYLGTVYAPSATCELAGTTDGIHEFSSQVICGTVIITGNASINIDYEQDTSHYLIPTLEQFK